MMMRPPRRTVLLVNMAVVGGAMATAQVPAPRVFEVVSVKPSDPNAMPPVPFLRPGRDLLTATNMTLRNLVQHAFSVEEFQVQHSEPWHASRRFDVVGKTMGVSSLPEMRAMLKSLLVERFKLSTHTEVREMPVVMLVRSRADRLGPGLKTTTVDCASTSETTRCGVTPFGGRGSFGLRGVGQPMAVIARLVSQTIRAQVRDQTGLTGLYDFEFAFDPQQLTGVAASFGGNMPSPGAPTETPQAPALDTALNEQLGLTLNRQRGDVEIVIIDSAAIPVSD
jgi:uncharacterized protein (TIGR03435 family)